MGTTRDCIQTSSELAPSAPFLGVQRTKKESERDSTKEEIESSQLVCVGA